MAEAAPSRTAEILLVESNPNDADFMRTAFQKLSVPIHLNVLASGRDALEFCRREAPLGKRARPDLMLLDLHLPDISGFEVLEAVKRDEALRRIPVVVLGNHDNGDVSKAYHMGANSFIFKPEGLADYIRMVKGVEDFWLTVVMLPRD